MEWNDFGLNLVENKGFLDERTSNFKDILLSLARELLCNQLN
jgi:hypothetical protein